MSDIKIQPSGSGTATVTLTAPVSNTARTITLPDSTSTLATTTNFTSTGIDDNADALAITITSAENVGIGTTSPDQKLHVAGNAVVTGITRIGDGSASSPAYQFVSDTNTGMFRIGSDQLGFSTAGGQAMMINAAGLVGIGINASANNLEVYKSAGASVRISSGANDSDAYLRVQSGNATGESYIAFGDEDDWDIGKIAYLNNGNYLVFTTNASEAMRLDSYGRLALGGTAVGNIMMSVTGDGSGADQAGIRFIDSNSGNDHQIYNNGGSLYFRDYTAGQTRMEILSNGNILIGTSNASPAETNGVTGTRIGQNGGCQFSASGTTMVVNRDNTEGTAIELRQAGSFRGTIAVHGETCSFNTTSDYRLKENVDYTWDATTRLKQLKPARFNFITDDTNTLMDGFIAHEVSSVVPEAITGEKDATEMQCIDQSKLVPLLVKTIQELEARITALE